jgi:hypothetical protein
MAAMQRSAGTVWLGAEGPITQEMLRSAVPDITSRRVHLCGPPGMMEAMRRQLAELGVPEAQIHTEAFGPASIPADAAELEVREAAPSSSKQARAASEVAPTTVTFSISGISAPCLPTKPFSKPQKGLGLKFLMPAGSGSASLRHQTPVGRGVDGRRNWPGARGQGQWVHFGLSGKEHRTAAGGRSLMRERGDILVGLMVAFLLLFPLGYLVHVSPRFPGSLVGGLTGIAAASLLLLTVPYVLVKHVGWIARFAGRWASRPTVLAIHIYAGMLAAVLGLIHAAHTMNSPAGVVLTGDCFSRS